MAGTTSALPKHDAYAETWGITFQRLHGRNSINGKRGRSTFLRNVLVNRTRCQNPEADHLYNNHTGSHKTYTHEYCFVNDTIQTLVTPWIQLQATDLTCRNVGTISRSRRKWDATDARAVTCQCTQSPLPTSFTPLHTARSHIATTGHGPRSVIQQIKRQ